VLAELETTHFYGFTLGSDVNAVGEIEGEFEAIGRFAKAHGSYAAIDPTIGLKFIPITNFSIEPIIGAAVMIFPPCRGSTIGINQPSAP
jgi:hypothetical protein